MIRTTSLADLQLERDEVRSLLDLARRVLAEGNESKFSKLREFLLKPEYRREKLIIFTEHRDTLAWLLQGLEGMGFTDRIAAIHGGLDFRDREAEVEHFKRATADGGAQYLLATDAAGEGINLQFCWLMVNYDVPWNPARLEQRLGRIHRYGQEHDPVVIINLIANNTREGLVIGTLLRKLEVMRRELRSDKVFDVVGRIFENVSIARYMTDALVDDAATQTARRLEGQLTREQFDALEQRERVLFGEGGDVTQQLPRLRQVTEREALRKLLPGYVRQFVHGAADVLRLGIDGDLDGCFSLKPLQRGVLDPVWEALEDYPPDLRRRLTVYRPKHEEAVFLHPGEPVFERLRRVVLERSAPDRLRGAAFTDPTARDPYLIFVAELSLVRRADAGRDTPLHSRLVAVKVNPDATLALCPVEHFLLLDGCDRFPTEFVQLASRAEEFEERLEHHLRDKVATPLVTERQYELRRDLPSREALLVRGFDFQLADLVAARQRLTEKARQGDARAMTDLERIKTQQRALDRRKAESVAELHAEPDRIAIGGVSVFARALVVPSTSEADRERYDADVEAIAMQVARAYEEAAGAAVHDVSTPPKARAAGLTDYPGFDLLATYPTGERRAIEVKGRSRRGGHRGQDERVGASLQSPGGVLAARGLRLRVAGAATRAGPRPVHEAARPIQERGAERGRHSGGRRERVGYAPTQVHSRRSCDRCSGTTRLTSCGGRRTGISSSAVSSRAAGQTRSAGCGSGSVTWSSPRGSRGTRAEGSTPGSFAFGKWRSTCPGRTLIAG